MSGSGPGWDFGGGWSWRDPPRFGSGHTSQTRAPGSKLRAGPNRRRLWKPRSLKTTHPLPKPRYCLKPCATGSKPARTPFGVRGPNQRADERLLGDGGTPGCDGRRPSSPSPHLPHVTSTPSSHRFSPPPPLSPRPLLSRCGGAVRVLPAGPRPDPVAQGRPGGGGLPMPILRGFGRAGGTGCRGPLPEYFSPYYYSSLIYFHCISFMSMLIFN